MGGKASANIIGYRYFMSIHMGIGRGPVNEVRQMKANDVLFYNSVTDGVINGNAAISIDKKYLFGGDDKEGGLEGVIQFLFGHDTQVVPGWVKDLMVKGQIDPDTSTALSTTLIPEFRGAATLFYDGQICSNNPYPKAWKIRASRFDAGWEDDDTFYPDKALVTLSGDIQAMNGAHIIYECATNSAWGRGMAKAFLDDDSFIACADTLYNEAFGLCLPWNRQDDIDKFVQTVLNHIGGALYIDRGTGLLTLKLIRNDYDIDDIPSFDYGSGLLSIQDDQAAASNTNYNEVIVTYRDVLSDIDGQVRVQNLAAIQALGGRIISTTVDYKGAPLAELALRLAQRDITMQSSSLRRMTVTLDRSAWRIAPGGVFKISAPTRGITNLVLRAGSVKDSKINDGTITIEAVQDVFSISFESFIGVQPSVWTPPDRSARVVDPRRLEELTFYDLAHFVSAADLETAISTPDQTSIKVFAKRPTDLSSGFLIDDAAASEPFVVRGSGVFNSVCDLVGNLGAYDTAVTFAHGSELDDVDVGDVALIDDEYVRIDDFDPLLGQATIARGCLDTIPAEHFDGTLIWIQSVRPNVDNREYSSGETVHVKLLTQTSSEQLAEADAPTDDILLAGRQGRPYPPGDFKINTIPFADLGETVLAAVDIDLTWAHRDRIQQGDFVVEHEAGSNGPEDGVTYRVRIVNHITNVIIRTTSGITDDHWTYTVAMQTSDGPLNPFRVELESVRDGLVSWQHYAVRVFYDTPSGEIDTSIGFDEDFDYNFNGDAGFGDGFDDNFDG